MPSADDMAGQTFGKYVVVRRIAVGGMAEVCLARLEGAAGFNKLVVVKQVLPQFAEDPAFIDMFLDEGRLAARLTHPNIAQTFELGQERGRYFMAMEYVPGRSLAAIFEELGNRNEQLPLACAMRITMQLLEALGYAHAVKDARGKSLSLVHRDVTPSNVMVTFDGSVKLLDFGIAKAAAQSHQTRAGRVKGKAGYMSPEQCRGKELDARSDLYSAGALLYQQVTGRRPFEELMSGGSEPIAVMQATLRGGFAKPTQVAPNLPGAIDDIVLKAMALKADDRYASAGLMLRQLESFSTAMGIFPSTQKLADLMAQLFPGAGDEVEPANPPPLPSPAEEKPGPPVATLPEVRAFVPPVAPDESDAKTQVRRSGSKATPMPELIEPESSQSGETSHTAETPHSGEVGVTSETNLEGEPSSGPGSGPEVPTELSRASKKKRGLPLGWLALAFTGAVALGLIAVTFLAPAPIPALAPPPSPVARPAPLAPAEAAEEPSFATGTVSLDAFPKAVVTWGETVLGETPVVVEVPPGDQAFVFQWGPKKSRSVTLAVKASETTIHREELEPQR